MREKIPLFPLPNVVLFPDVILPLHIFEPRYRLMVESALQGPKRIGMVLLKKGWEEKYYENPDIYPVGCMGEIVDQERFPDGRFNILLKGISRFSVSKIVQPEPYREAKISLLPDRIENVTESETERTREKLRGAALSIPEFFVYNKMRLNRVPVDFTAPLATIIDTLSYYLSIDPYEKQPILEETRVSERADLLYHKMVGMLQMKKVYLERKHTTGDPSLN